MSSQFSRNLSSLVLLIFFCLVNLDGLVKLILVEFGLGKADGLVKCNLFDFSLVKSNVTNKPKKDNPPKKYEQFPRDLLEIKI